MTSLFARVFLCCGLVLAGGHSAGAQGFAITDLTKAEATAKTAFGATYETKTTPERMTIACSTCKDVSAVDVLLGRQTDGTEQRVRAGTTTMEKLQDLCRQRDPNCALSALSVAPAVGWRSTWAMGETAIILRNGDLLTIRSISGDKARAKRQLDTALGKLAPAIIGR